MSSKSSPPKEITIDGVKISEDLIEVLKEFSGPDLPDAKNTIAKSVMVLASMPGDCEIDREFFSLQHSFYELLEALEKGEQKGGNDA